MVKYNIDKYIHKCVMLPLLFLLLLIFRIAGKFSILMLIFDCVCFLMSLLFIFFIYILLRVFCFYKDNSAFGEAEIGSISTSRKAMPNKNKRNSPKARKGRSGGATVPPVTVAEGDKTSNAQHQGDN